MKSLVSTLAVVTSTIFFMAGSSMIAADDRAQKVEAELAQLKEFYSVRDASILYGLGAIDNIYHLGMSGLVNTELRKEHFDKLAEYRRIVLERGSKDAQQRLKRVEQLVEYVATARNAETGEISLPNAELNEELDIFEDTRESMALFGALDSALRNYVRTAVKGAPGTTK